MTSSTELQADSINLPALRVAIVHYWFVRRRGGEQVVEALAEMFPQADIFTLVLDPASLGKTLQGHRIQSSFLRRIPGIIRHYQKFMVLFPLALESFDLADYDLVISSESGPAKGVITGTQTCHICYCHTPMRYIWDMYSKYRKEAPGGVIGRMLFSLIAHYLRLWDVATAQRVDYFVANSQHVSQRIWKTYRRSAKVIHPPVAVDEYNANNSVEGFYLVVSQLVFYKRVDLAIEACNRLRRKLIVIGEGQESESLRRIAGPTVTMMGWQSTEVLRDHYGRCRALLFPGEEDFGMTPVEVQASGRPVIALGRGGALETVRGYFPSDKTPPADPSGVFFEEASVEFLIAAILEFEKNEMRFSPQKIKAQVQHFNRQRFKAEMGKFIREKLEHFRLEKNFKTAVS